MSKCKFIAISILAKQREPGYLLGDEIELDYRRFDKKTIKHFVDAVYDCNVQPLPISELLKLLQLVTKMGYTEKVDGKREFTCTAEERVNE